MLWTSGVCLNVSMVLRDLIVAQWLYDTTGEAALLGLLGVVMLLQLPLGLYGGALADRVDRKKLMIATQSVAVVVTASLAVLAAAGSLAPWHVFAVTAISGIANTMGAAARPAMLPRTVPRERLPQAVTVLTISGQVAQIGSPLFFSGLYDGLGVPAALFVTTAVTAASMVLPMLIRATGKPSDRPRTSTWVSLKDGFVFVAKHPLLPGLYGLDFAVTIVSFYRQLFPIFARELYGMGATGTGLLVAANSIGSIAGSFLVFSADRIAHKGRIVLAASMAYAVFLITFGLVHVIWIGLGIVAVLGATDAVTMTMRQTIVQLTTPDRLLGRASAVRNVVATGSNNLGQIEVGVMSSLIGAGSTMVLGGALAIAFVGVIWKYMPGIWNYQYHPTQATAEPPTPSPRSGDP